VDLLERLLRHDRWTTRQLLLQCRALTPAQWDQRFDFGHQTLSETFRHMLANVRAWSDLMRERPVRRTTGRPGATAANWLDDLDAIYDEFAGLARRVSGEGRLDETYLDVLDTPPTRKTYGGTILHVITHNMHHRCELMQMLGRLDVPGLIEGDVLGWEQQARSPRT
jgi:uncharacterized damage-inducible protein DinB